MLVEPKNWTFVEDNGFLSFIKNMTKNIGKNISKYLSGTQLNILDHAKQSATDALIKAWRKVFHQTAEATGDLISNKMFMKLQKSQDFNTE